MVLAIIFGIVTIFAVLGLLRSLKEKNLLGSAFAFLTLAVFGFFTVMTIIDTFKAGGFLTH